MRFSLRTAAVFGLQVLSLGEFTSALSAYEREPVRIAARQTADGPVAFTLPDTTSAPTRPESFLAEEDVRKEEEPEHIRDNAFLVEEAFNQEKGEIQHIVNWVQLFDRADGGRSRAFTQTYTMEIPLGSQKHQFSFTTQLFDSYDRPAGQGPDHQGGVGDTYLNYRYQLAANDDFLWCAPRCTLIVPTGDSRFELGAGRVGYQFNLPISHYGDQFDFHFNAGYTMVPNVAARIPIGFPIIERDLQGFNLGASVFWKPKVNLNFFVETLALSNDVMDEFGDKSIVDQLYVNPGTRYAVCQFEQVEWVLGVSMPIGLTRDTPDYGLFFYMSIEHIFRKVEE